MYSQERRRERYRVLYVWKMFENLVPTIHCGGNGGIMKLHPRNGRTMSLPTIDTKCPRAVQKMRDSNLVVHGAKLFNSMPKTLRNASNCSLLEFKSKLDCFLVVSLTSHTLLDILKTDLQTQIVLFLWSRSETRAPPCNLVAFSN